MDSYQEFADGLLEYKDRRGELTRLFHEAFDESRMPFPREDRFSDGSRGPLQDICPFTVMASFNRGIKLANSMRIFESLKSKLGISAPVLLRIDEIGIPTVQNLQSWFFGFNSDRKDDDIGILWRAFEAALELERAETEDAKQLFIESYDAARAVKGVRVNLSQGLYWIRPNRFVALDQHNQRYINRHLPELLFGTSMPDGAKYLDLCDNVREVLKRPVTAVSTIPALSRAAFGERDEPSQPSTPGISDPEAGDVVQPKPSLPDLAASLYLPARFLATIDTLLEEKRQVIFQGPPGTGKTFVAQELAEHLAGSPDRVSLVQFHPSYSYEDFVQGYRPTLKDGQPGFELRDGPLLRAAEQARQNSNANHYLIIDEINRGNIANVFGELYFLLEYRDKEINLQYDDKPFSLPDNLFIIGTMNTADRSIALVDLALRRRFYFVQFHPDDEPVQSVLRKYLEAQGLEEMLWVADVVEAANEKLRDDRHAAIGPSYFMRDNLNEETVERIWKHSVLPYIEERRFGGNAVSDEFSLSSLRRDVSGISAPIESIIQDAEITEDEANTGE